MRGFAKLWPVTAAIAALALTGCGTVDAAKSGGGTPPITLTLATGDPQGRASAVAAEALAHEIEARSRGGIEVEVLWQSFLGAEAEDPVAINDYSGETYAEVARQVEEGEVDLAIVPDFAWVQRGSRSIESLKVPFLIDSVDLMIEAARRVGVEPLSDLVGLGVTPLALLPEGLRHPVGFDRPLTGLADFRDSGIRSVDVTAWPTLLAWGARPVSIAGSYAAAVEDGSVVGTETSFAFADTLPRPGAFTGDVTHTAKFTTIVASTERWQSLSPGQRTMIEDAAAVTFDGVAETLPDEREAGIAYCERGGTIVHAGESGRSGLEQAVATLVARLREDARTAEVVETIADLKAELPPPQIAAECSPGPVDPPPGDPGETAAFPEGTYRAELTVEDFTSRGIAEDVARNHADIWTLTFRDGRMWDLDCPGSTYSVRDGRVSVVLGRGDPACGEVAGGELFSAAWTFDGSVLRFHDVRHGVEGPMWQTFTEVLWGSQEWVKIG